MIDTKCTIHPIDNQERHSPKKIFRTGLMIFTILLLGACATREKITDRAPAQTLSESGTGSKLEFDYNLLEGGNFPPIMMEPGQTTGARGWMVTDHSRLKVNHKNRTKGYLPGQDCFSLTSFENGLNIRFKEDIPEKYDYYNPQQCWWQLRNANTAWLLPPAKQYRLMGEVKLDKGSLEIDSGGIKKFQPAAGWQSFDYLVSLNPIGVPFSFCVILRPKPGMDVSLRNFRMIPVYERTGGAIKLPGNGKLERIVIPADNNLMLRAGAMFWKGWLWRLTGVALPIETEENPAPSEGALVIRPGQTATAGGYRLKIDRQGGLLEYTRPYAVRSALMNYIREFGFRAFSHDQIVMPETNPALVLKPVDQEMNPKFDALLDVIHCGAAGFVTMANGGISDMEFDGMGDADIYQNYFPSGINSHTMTNMLLPYSRYGKTHPEYYAMGKDGKRVSFDTAGGKTARIHACLSNPDVQRIVAARIKALWDTYGEDRYMLNITLADGVLYCQCPQCRALDPNPSDDSLSDVYHGFVNRIARQFPERKFSTYAYLREFSSAPLKNHPEKNSVVMYCPWPTELICQMHADCPLTQKQSLPDIKAWSELVGKDDTSFFIYDEYLYPMIDRLNLLASYGRCHLQTTCMHDNLRFYVASRWNFGDDPETAIADYCAAIYGRGGEAMHQAFRLEGDICRAYKHPKEDFKKEYVYPYNYYGRPAAFTRENFDAMYAVYDQAIAAAQDEPEALTRILYQKNRLMVCDLRMFPRGQCLDTKAVNVFATRLATFIKDCSRMFDLAGKNNYPYTAFKTSLALDINLPPRGFLLSFGGLDIGNTGLDDWTKEPIALDFLRNPGKFISVGTEKISGGWRWKPFAMMGGEGASPSGITTRNILRRPSSGKNRVKMEFSLKRDMDTPCLLSIEGLDDEKPGRATWKILANGKTIHEGVNHLAESNWTQSAPSTPPSNWSVVNFTVPAGLLKQGENSLEIINTTPDRDDGVKKSVFDKNGTFIGEETQQNYYWGWIGLSDIRLFELPAQFRRYLDGQPSSWKPIDWEIAKPQGAVTAGKGELKLISAGAKLTGIFLPLKDILFVKPGEKFSITIKAQGKGTLNVGFWAYRSGSGQDAKTKFVGGDSVTFKLTDIPGKFDSVLTVDKTANSIMPFIAVEADSSATVTDWSIEAVVPNANGIPKR